MHLPALPPDAFRGKPFVYDLIYAPPQTKLLALAEQAGCRTMNGIQMLAHQGALSLAIWTGLPVEEIPVSVMIAGDSGKPVKPEPTRRKKRKRNHLRGFRVYDIMVNAIAVGAGNHFLRLLRLSLPRF